MSRKTSPAPDRNDHPTGSPQSGGPEFLAVGHLMRPHGVKGEIIMDILTDFPQRLRKGKVVYAGEAHRSLTIESVRKNDPFLLLRFEEFSDRDQVAKLTNAILYVKADELPQLPEGKYYHHQLLGLRVIDETDAELGVLTQILETGANDVYLITTPDGHEILIPAIESVILVVDLDRRIMRIRPQTWE